MNWEKKKEKKNKKTTNGVQLLVYNWTIDVFHRDREYDANYIMYYDEYICILNHIGIWYIHTNNTKIKWKNVVHSRQLHLFIYYFFLFLNTNNTIFFSLLSKR